MGCSVKDGLCRACGSKTLVLGEMLTAALAANETEAATEAALAILSLAGGCRAQKVVRLSPRDGVKGIQGREAIGVVVGEGLCQACWGREANPAQLEHECPFDDSFNGEGANPEPVFCTCCAACTSACDRDSYKEEWLDG